MIVLADNDVLIALAQCDLVDEALTVLGCGFNDCYVLGEAPFSLYLTDEAKCFDKRLGNHRAFDRLCYIVDSCKKLGPADEDIGLLEELLQIEGVHDGELQLTLHAENLYRANTLFTVTTGDKTFLKAIYDSDCMHAQAILSQRVECLESLLLKALALYGHEYITHKIGVGKSTTTKSNKFDGVLSMAFGNGRDLQHTTSCLNNYMDPVRYFLRP
ncbi:hypothetical protein [Pseudomonas avellanae]|uniref:hypothetical protein n=1 Tax=Pseudomonas avellanae TaxID=46257 RepID=UPI0004625BED|nr:hypothetical protein [Pseudomonas avellanae]UQW67399.1 hypothetical protein L2Y00_19155 [Pseudomonas avellanae]GGJ32809.1 hypothetical protein GCM10009085_28540 [Pseudomonas avellanae]